MACALTVPRKRPRPSHSCTRIFASYSDVWSCLRKFSAFASARSSMRATSGSGGAACAETQNASTAVNRNLENIEHPTSNFEQKENADRAFEHSEFDVESSMFSNRARLDSVLAIRGAKPDGLVLEVMCRANEAHRFAFRAH